MREGARDGRPLVSDLADSGMPLECPARDRFPPRAARAVSTIEVADRRLPPVAVLPLNIPHALEEQADQTVQDRFAPEDNGPEFVGPGGAARPDEKSAEETLAYRKSRPVPERWERRRRAPGFAWRFPAQPPRARCWPLREEDDQAKQVDSLLSSFGLLDARERRVGVCIGEINCPGGNWRF